MNRFANSIEVELLNGEHILIENDWSKLYNIKEKTRHFIKMVSRFPFLTLEKEKYVKFKFRKQYTYLDSPFDPSFKVRCSLSQLAALFGVDFRKFEETLLYHDLGKYQQL